MRDPKRLLDSLDDEAGVAVLAAARRDGPSREARRALLAALGAAATMGASTSVVAAASKAATSAGVAPVAAGAGSVAVTTGAAGLVGVKVVGGVVLALALTGVGIVVQGRWASDPSPSPPPSVAATTPARPVGGVPEPHRAAPAASASDAPSTEVTAVAPLPAPAPPPAASSARRRAPAPSLAEEIARIDAARSAVSRGETARALRELDAYERAVAEPTFAPEALLLRVEALMARGEPDRAAAIVATLERRFPRSPQATRARRVLGGPP